MKTEDIEGNGMQSVLFDWNHTLSLSRIQEDEKILEEAFMRAVNYEGMIWIENGLL